MCRDLLPLLIEFDQAFGPSGDLREVAALLQRHMKGLFDEYFEDAIGNQYYIRHGKNRERKILFAAHMDEIAFVINHIDETGFAYIFPVGYHDERLIINQHLVFLGENGEKVYGVTGSKPAHILSKEEMQEGLSSKDIFVDFGTASYEETRKLGIDVGSYGVFSRQGVLLNGGNCFTGKAIDNRASMVALVEVFREMKDTVPDATVCFVATADEETGTKGGQVAAMRIDPEIFLSVDVSLGGDVPHMAKKDRCMKLGKGVAIKLFDWDPGSSLGNLVPVKLSKFMVNVAEKYHIPYQKEVLLHGGTDSSTAAFAGTGYLAGGVGIPQRYMHTTVGVINLKDLETTKDYILKLIEEYGENGLSEIKK